MDILNIIEQKIQDIENCINTNEREILNRMLVILVKQYINNNF